MCSSAINANAKCSKPLFKAAVQVLPAPVQTIKTKASVTKQKQIVHLKNIIGQYSASENTFKAPCNCLS